MQEYVDEKSIAFVFKGVRLTEQMLKAAIRKFLAAQKNERNAPTKTKHGKVSVKKLFGEDQGASSIEITGRNIKSFEKMARKYGVDFAVKKVRNETPPKYIVFFKARDADALMAAFKEYAAKKVKTKRPSALAQLRKMKALVKGKSAERVKNKAKEKTR